MGSATASSFQALATAFRAMPAWVPPGAEPPPRDGFPTFLLYPWCGDDACLAVPSAAERRERLRQCGGGCGAFSGVFEHSFGCFRV